MTHEELRAYYNKNLKGHTNEEFKLAYDAMDIMFANNIDRHTLTTKDRRFIVKKLNKNWNQIHSALSLVKRWSYYVEECEKSYGCRPFLSVRQ